MTSVFRTEQPLPTADRRLVVASLRTSESDLLQMKPIIAGLSSFIEQYPRSGHVHTAACALLKFTHTLGDSCQDTNAAEQAKLIAEVRTELYRTPAYNMEKWANLIPVLVINSYLYAVVIASSSDMTRVVEVLFMHRRVEAIGCAYDKLLRLRYDRPDDAEEIDAALDLAVVPLMYAVRRQIQHASPAEAGHVPG